MFRLSKLGPEMPKSSIDDIFEDRDPEIPNFFRKRTFETGRTSTGGKNTEKGPPLQRKTRNEHRATSDRTETAGKGRPEIPQSLPERFALGKFGGQGPTCAHCVFIKGWSLKFETVLLVF